MVAMGTMGKGSAKREDARYHVDMEGVFTELSLARIH